MIRLILLVAAIVTAFLAAIGVGPWLVGSATITLLPLAVMFFAASFLPFPEPRREP